MWRKEIDVMNSYKLDLEKYAVLAREAVAEGCVLLENEGCLLYTSPSPRDRKPSRMPSSA